MIHNKHSHLGVADVSGGRELVRCPRQPGRLVRLAPPPLAALAPGALVRLRPDKSQVRVASGNTFPIRHLTTNHHLSNTHQSPGYGYLPRHSEGGGLENVEPRAPHCGERTRWLTDYGYLFIYHRVSRLLLPHHPTHHPTIYHPTHHPTTPIPTHARRSVQLTTWCAAGRVLRVG